MKRQFKRVISMLCVILVLSGIPAMCFAAYAPSSDDLRGCNSRIASPAWYSWLDSYETRFLKTRHGVRAYLRYGPDENSGYYDYVYEGAQVTVLARENGYSLVKTAEGMAGWVTSSLLVSSY